MSKFWERVKEESINYEKKSLRKLLVFEENYKKRNKKMFTKKLTTTLKLLSLLKFII